MTAFTKSMLSRAGMSRINGQDLDAPGLDFGQDERRKLGAYIAGLRIGKGLTQGELGRILGVRNTYISGIELGRSSISRERCRGMAAALGVSPQAFAKKILRHYHPWLYTMLYDGELEQELPSIPNRLQDLRREVP